MVSFILRDRISTIVDAYDKDDAIEQGHKYLENCFTSRFQINAVLRNHGHAGDIQAIELRESLEKQINTLKQKQE